MRIARKLFLLSLMATAAMASMAASASALEGVPETEIVREDAANAHCPPVTGSPPLYAGGCEVHFGEPNGEGGRNEYSLVGHVFGIEATASDCRVEFEARIDEDGEGYVYQAHYSGDATHNCTRTPCGLPWRIHGEENEPVGSGETIHAEFCRHPTSGADNKCEIEAPIVDVGAGTQNNHDYHLPLTDVPGTPHTGTDCEYVSGELGIETGPTNSDTPHEEIEIIHPPA